VVAKLPCPVDRYILHLLGGSEAALLGKLLYPTLGWVVVRRALLGKLLYPALGWVMVALPCSENYCIQHLAEW